MALRQRSKPVAIAMIGVLCVLIALLYQQFSQTLFTDSQDASSPMQALLAHQINGLAHPFDQRYSTGQDHVQQIVDAFESSLHHPLGFGLGATTLSAAKFGATGISAEFDIANVFLAGGIIAGILYVAVLYRTFRAGGTLTFRYKRTVDVLVFASVAVTFGQTLSGGYYSLMPFIWMFIAWIDRRATDALAPERLSRRPSPIWKAESCG
jgi:hypothetical protein